VEYRFFTEVKKGSKATLDWLRNKGKDDDKTDPTGEFRKLDQLMPQKRDQTPESRSRDIEGALDWMNSEGTLDGLADGD
jgi:hypothetical protein